MGKLDGKHAIVTGASRGIGQYIAELFAKEGAKVICAARTVNEGDHPFAGSVNTTVKAIRDAGGEATAMGCDVGEYEACVKLVEDARKIYGPVDIVVNNAALTYFVPIKDFPLSKWHRSFNINFHAIFYLSQLGLQDMLPRKSGAIVNISSGAAIGPGRGPYANDPLLQRGGTLYGAEKAAMERFTQGLAAEVYHDGVSVTCVSPSLVVPTPGTLHHKLVSGMDDPRGESPELMAKAALLLATEPIEKVSGRVCYDQQILQEFGWITNGRGTGIDRKGSGYSLI
jgi:NAD(P)-dependent dehydrogenase (short-subunit alcohol dehydrogenase family)